MYRCQQPQFLELLGMKKDLHVGVQDFEPLHAGLFSFPVVVGEDTNNGFAPTALSATSFGSQSTTNTCQEPDQ